MAKDILTFALEGEIALQDFASAISSFNALLIQLSKEVGGDAKIDWLIDEMYTGSAVATFRGVYQDMVVVENVVTAYEDVGDAMAAGREIPFSKTVQQHAAALTKVLDDKVTAIRLETPNHDFLISGKLHGERTLPIQYSHGTVRGTIETLSKRKKLSFTLWDTLFDKPVHCYFKEGEEDNMRFAWGKRAVVAGKIGRQPESGKPLVIREVKYVRVVEDGEPGSYQRARGVLPWGRGGETPEDMIRRLRDA
ncbi:MAG: hypothetical protein ABIJ39_07010 [Chloroflexota bacterium]